MALNDVLVLIEENLSLNEVYESIVDALDENGIPPVPPPCGLHSNPPKPNSKFEKPKKKQTSSSKSFDDILKDEINIINKNYLVLCLLSNAIFISLFLSNHSQCIAK